MRAGDLLDRLQDRAFEPFRLHLNDGSKLDVTEPDKVLVGASDAVVPTSWIKDEEGRRFAKRWRTVSLDQIVQLGEIPGTTKPPRRKRK